MTENNTEIDYKELYLCALADYQNLQRRSLEEKRAIAKKASYDTLLSILPLYQDAKEGMKYNESGATLLYKKFVKFLNDHNIGIINDKFFEDHTDGMFSDEFATAISTVPCKPEEDDLFPNDSAELYLKMNNKIQSVIEDGFYDITTNEIISYAKVIVYKVA